MKQKHESTPAIYEKSSKKSNEGPLMESSYGTTIKSIDEREIDGDSKAMFSRTGKLLSWVI